MSKLEKAALFMEAVGMKKNFEDNIAAEVKQALAGLKDDPNIQNLREMSEELKRRAKDDKDELMQKLTELIADMFTEEELDTVIAFNATPIGNRLLRELPNLYDRSDDLARSWLHGTSKSIWKQQFN